MRNNEVLQIRLPGHVKAEIEECAAELEISVSEWVRDACESYRLVSQPTLRYVHDASKVPAHLRAAWDMEHINDERYKRPMP